jgi:hypothetical protein
MVLSSALALLVARVLTDHPDDAVSPDHLALLTDRLDTWPNFHVASLSSGYLYR